MAVRPRLRRAALVLVIGTCCATSPRAQDRPANPAAGDERLATARNQLRTLLVEAGANGRIGERSRGNYFFAPSRGDLPDAVIRNPAEVGALAVGPQLRVWGTLDDNGALTIKRYMLAVAAERPTESAESALLPDDVRAASDQIVAALTEALRPGTMSVTDRTLDGPSSQSRSIKDDLARIRSAYRQAIDNRADSRQITAIVRKYAEARRQVADAFTQSDEHKALYRSAKNYDPWRYDVIFRQARAAVAIGEPGDSGAVQRCADRSGPGADGRPLLWRQQSQDAVGARGLVRLFTSSGWQPAPAPAATRRRAGGPITESVAQDDGWGVQFPVARLRHPAIRQKRE